MVTIFAGAAAEKRARDYSVYAPGGCWGQGLMPLTMRPTEIQSLVDRNRDDYTIYSGDWAMGRIYEERGAPVNLRWFWSLHGIISKPLAMRTDGRAPTLDEAKAQFERLGGAGRGAEKRAGRARALGHYCDSLERTLSNVKGNRSAPSLPARVTCPHSSQTNRSEPTM